MSLEFKKRPYFMPVFFDCEEANSHSITDTEYHEPADINVISLTYETEREALESCIPDCYELLEPYVNIKFCEFFNCSWLAGKGYTLINISCPVHFKGERDDLDGKYTCRASAWGKPFLEMTVDTNIEASEEDIAEIKKVEGRTQGKFQYKYIPQVREKDEPYEANYTRADCAYPTILPPFEKPEDYPYELGASESEWGMGSIEIKETSWEDWPHLKLSALSQQDISHTRTQVYITLAIDSDSFMG